MKYATHQVHTRKTRAFTLVETLVAITILTLSILAPFDAVERVINSSRLAKDQLIASSLAQEAMEYVRFFRTSNYLGHSATLMDGMNGTGNRFGSNICTTNLCTIDGTLGPVASVLGTCGSSNVKNCPVLNLVTTGGNTGVYTQVTGGTNAPTIFKRGFTYKQYSDHETVTVRVQWEDHGTQNMVLTENLYDWF